MAKRNKDLLADQFARWPNLDFEGAFTTFAVKDGCSERVHIDWNDDRRKFAYVVAVGQDWTGGDFCCPTLEVTDEKGVRHSGIRIPVRRGQILEANTKKLPHCATMVTSGRRVVFTFFTDKFTTKHTEELSNSVV